MYRGRTKDNIRDMQVTSLRKAAWQPAHAIHADGWKLNGCPTNSGELTALGQEVTAVWFTGVPGKRVLLARSHDSGHIFDAPVVIDHRAPVGRAAVTTFAEGSAAVAWLGSANKETTLFAMRVARVATESAIPVAKASSSTSMGFPSIASSRNLAMLTWTESDKSAASIVRVALLR